MAVKDVNTSNDDAKSSQEYGQKIVKLQEEYLIPLKEDLSDWINRVLGIDDINANNFIQKLDSGVIVCKLAKHIEERCLLNPELEGHFIYSRQSSLTSQSSLSLSKVEDNPNDYKRIKSNEKSLGRRPSINDYHLNADSNCISALKMKCWENAKSESFYARDNVSNFLKWCRRLQVREAVLFESEDLVLHNNPRSVVLCLLEVARIVCKTFLFSPAPLLVQFEKEIDAQERAELEKELAYLKENQGRKSNNVVDNKEIAISTQTGINDIIYTAGDEVIDGQCSINQDLKRTTSITSISTISGESTEANQKAAAKTVSQLDQKVMLIAKSYYGKKAKHGIERLAEGKYRIAGKIVFVRLLKDRHVMVRVGGGWDTLQHFLERHGNDTVKEISPSDLLPMDTRPSESTSRRRDSQSSLQSVPSTPVLRRCLSSTQVSRSSLSSPEPWMSGSSNSSGYASGPTTYSSSSKSINGQKCNSTVATLSTLASTTNGSKINSQVNGTPNKTLIRRVSNLESISDRSNIDIKSNSYVLQHRRSSFTPANLKSGLNRTLYLNLSKASTTSNINLSSSSTSALTLPKDGDSVKQIRYPNYLQSSQHITSRTSNSNTSTPTKVTVGKVRRASLRAF